MSSHPMTYGCPPRVECNNAGRGAMIVFFLYSRAGGFCYFSRLRISNPIGLVSFSCLINCWIVSKTILNRWSYFFSSCAIFAARSLLDCIHLRSATKVRIIAMLVSKNLEYLFIPEGFHCEYNSFNNVAGVHFQIFSASRYNGVQV